MLLDPLLMLVCLCLAAQGGLHFRQKSMRGALDIRNGFTEREGLLRFGCRLLGPPLFGQALRFFQVRWSELRRDRQRFVNELAGLLRPGLPSEEDGVLIQGLVRRGGECAVGAQSLAEGGFGALGLIHIAASV